LQWITAFHAILETRVRFRLNSTRFQAKLPRF
jgi:hypothetical protein